MKLFVSNAPLNSYKSFDDIPPQIAAEISKNIVRAKTVAIDLESNKKTIWEFGGRNAAGTARKSNRNGLDNKELIKAVEGCLIGNESPCIVGHNLLEWDEPILNKHGISFPEASTRWDTLIASWILRPCIVRTLYLQENEHIKQMQMQTPVTNCLEHKFQAWGHVLKGSTMISIP